MNLHDVIMAEIGAPALVEHFGEQKRLRISAVGREHFFVVAHLLSESQVVQYNDDNALGAMVQTAGIMRSEFPPWMAGPEREMVITEMNGDEEGKDWAIDLDTTRWGSVVVTLGLTRNALLAQQEMRRAEV